MAMQTHLPVYVRKYESFVFNFQSMSSNTNDESSDKYVRDAGEVADGWDARRREFGNKITAELIREKQILWGHVKPEKKEKKRPRRLSWDGIKKVKEARKQKAKADE